MRRLPAGFTLIELLVVISLIGLLASIVMAALASARGRARDSSIKEELIQMRTLLEENIGDYGTYTNLQTSTWINTTGGCTAGIPSTNGSYASQAQQLCVNIMNQESGSPGQGTYLYLGTQLGYTQKYSMLVWLPGQQVYLCVGSDGISTVNDGGGWSASGCWANP